MGEARMSKRFRKGFVGILCAVVMITFFGVAMFISMGGVAEAAIASSYTIKTVGSSTLTLSEKVSADWYGSTEKSTTIYFTENAYWAIKNGAVTSISYSVSSKSPSVSDPREIKIAGVADGRKDGENETHSVTVSGTSGYGENTTSHQYSASVWLHAWSGGWHNVDTTWNNIGVSMTNTDTTGPTIQTKSGTTYDNFATNAWISVSTIAMKDVGTGNGSASGIWKYELKDAGGTIVKSGNFLSDSTTNGEKTFTLPSQGKYTLQVWDMIGNSTTKTFQYFNPTLKVTAFLNGVQQSTTDPGDVGFGTSYSDKVATTKAVKDETKTLVAKTNEGFYFEKFVGKTSPADATYYTKSQSVKVLDTWAYTTEYNWEAHFRTITTGDKTVTYSGSSQGVDAPTLISNAFNYKVTYTGTSKKGESYNSTTGPTDAGTYSALVEVYYGATTNSSNLRGSKTVTLTIEKATPQLSTHSAKAITYGDTLSKSELTVTYVNPENNALAVVGKTPSDVEWSKPTVIPTRVPEYVAEYTFFPFDTANYVETTGTIVITVNQRVAELEWTDEGWFDYNGQIQSPTATVTNLVERNGEKDTCEVVLNGRARNVGSDYTVRATSLGNENYTLETVAEKDLFRYYIIRAIMMEARELEIDRDTWTWDYDGNTYTVSVNVNLKYGDVATVKYYVDGTEQSNAPQFKNVKWNTKNKVDSFTVGAVLTHDNYQTLDLNLEENRKSVQINIAEMEGFSFDNIEKTYDGQDVSPALNNDNGGLYTQFDDEVTAVYAIDGDENLLSVRNVKLDGNGVVVDYAATVTLTHPNYVTKTMTAKITVKKRPVLLRYEDVTAQYGDMPVLVPMYLTVEGVEESGLLVGESLAFSRPTVLNDLKRFNVEKSPYDSQIIPLVSGDNRNYDVSPRPCRLTVIPREITVQAVDMETIYGDVPETSAFGYFTYKTGDRSSVGVWDEGSIYVEPVYEGWQAYPVGDNEIKYQLTGTNPNYNLTFAPGVLTVYPRPVTVKALGDEIVYGETPDTSKYTERRTGYDDNTVMPGVMPGDSLILSGETATLYSVKRLEGGGYGSHEYTFSAEEGANPNYALTFEKGYVTVTPRPVTVTVKGATVAYGKPIPAFEITYTNLANNETVDDVTTPAVAKCEAIQFSNVGNYTVSLDPASANNYEFDCSSEATLTIEAVKIPTLNYKADALDYNGRSYDFKNALLNLMGLSGGSEPKAGKDGVSVAYRLVVESAVSLFAVDDGFSDVAPTNAGKYDVKVTYTPVEGDNYAKTVVVIEKGLIIHKIDPEIDLVQTVVNYTAYSAKGMKAEFYVDADCNDPFKEGGVTFEYYYDNAWQSVAPVSVGEYDVRATYAPKEDGNYNPVSVEKQALYINPVDAFIFLAPRTEEYCAKEWEANRAEVSGLGKDVLSQEISYEYSGSPLLVGSYDVTVKWTSDNPNYNSTQYFLEGAVKVTPNTTDLFFQILNNYVKDYDGRTVTSDVVDAQITVPSGWELHTGRLEYKFSRNGGTAVSSITEAGTYTVVATYIPGKNDQYASKTMTYTEGTVTINAVDVTFEWKKGSEVYNGKPRPLQVRAKGVDGGSVPQGQVMVLYKQLNGKYTEDVPVNAGNYSVRLNYMRTPTDNYLGTTEDHGEALVIEKAAVTIGLSYQTQKFTGDAVEYKKIVIGGIVGEAAPTGRIEVRYLYDGAWQTIPPYKSGKYDIRVFYHAVSSDGVEGNYASTDKTLSRGLVIENVAPVITLETKSAEYTGEAILSATPRIKADLNATTYIDSYEGTLRVEYLIGNNWSSSAPTDAGSYDVRVTYRASENDSFSSEMTVFDRALVIQQVKLTVVPFAGQFKEYDGLPHGVIGYTLKNVAGKDVGLLEEGVVTGALTAGTNPNAGEYPISVGDLTAGLNYELTMLQETVYYVIAKRTVVVNFGEIDPMYDGTEKTVETSINGLLEGDTVVTHLRYVGNRKNVGTFKAIVTMDSDNYVLAGGEQEFTIEPALITGVSLRDVVATYDGQPHTINPEGGEGCTFIFETAYAYTEVGGYVVRVRVEKPNHVTRMIEGTITILKGRQTISVKAPEGKLQYGDALPTLYAGEYGVATLDQGQELKPGTFSYSYTYVPFDTAHYETQTGFIELTVDKKAPTLGVEGSLVQWAQNPNKLNGTVDIPMENVEIYYESEDGSRFSQIPTEEGKYRVVVIYKGNDLYEAGEYVTTLVIQKPANYNWILIVGGVLIALALIAVVVVAVKRANEAK